MGPYRLLVVEDNHEVRRMVIASLKTLGEEIEVLDAPSAEEGLVVCSSQPIDLVVIDFRLPGMSGFDLITRLRKRKPETKIILVTGVEDDVIRKQVAEAKVAAYFFKPIDINTFLEAVKQALSAGDASFSSAETAPHPTPIAIAPPANDESSGADTTSQPAKVEPASIIHERLVELKKQVKAVSAMLANDAGQIIEEAGAASAITTGSPLLSALMHAFRASLHVSQAMARGTSESLLYFTAPRQCIYVAPVGLNHTLFVVTAGYFGPDKLGMIYHAIHLAVRDLQTALAAQATVPKESLRIELPPDVTVDKETLAKVENMFAHAPRVANRERADGFWESMEDGSTLDASHPKDKLSYEQARHLGLAPEKEKDA
jgi:DNA-binding response OmpR family regulator